MTVQLIVFLPLVAALVAGLGNRMIGNAAAKLVTTADTVVITTSITEVSASTRSDQSTLRSPE